MSSKIGEYTNSNTRIHLRTQSQAASETLPDPKIGEYTNSNTRIHLRTQSQAASETLPDPT